MKRNINVEEIKKWTDSVGGLTVATRLILDRLECSASKAEKLAGGRASGLPSPTEQKELSLLMKRPRNVLFPLLEQGRGRAS